MRVYVNTFFKKGCRIKDADLALQRHCQGGWWALFNVKQRWIKGNRNPNRRGGRIRQKANYGVLQIQAVANRVWLDE